MDVLRRRPGSPARQSRPRAHRRLLCAGAAPLPPFSSAGCDLDAIIVPSSRGAHFLGGAARLSGRLGVPLVVLCSGQSRFAEVVADLESSPVCGALVVDVPSDYRHDCVPDRVEAQRFRTAGARRASDLALKRNLGLLISRLHGWRKILFLDDDIEPLDPALARRLSAELDVHQIAGLICADYPDNSVACHARRLVGCEPGNFVSGAAMGVNCSDQPLPLFPNVYNEDYFFVSGEAAGRRLAVMGEAVQAPYSPFTDPTRARQEEFGDLLAEGLFALFESQPAEMSYAARLTAAGGWFWEQAISDRSAWHRKTHDALAAGLPEVDPVTETVYASAMACVSAAADQLSTLTPDLCVDFVDAWRMDLDEWKRNTQAIRARDTRAALDGYLGLARWDALGARRERIGVVV
jgi:hypothetical protein